MSRFLIVILFLLCFPLQDAISCTAVVISGNATPDGRPLLWKHRDTDCLDNRLEFFRGERFCFTGLVNSGGNIAPSASPSDREVWIGANTAGFSIMNTASYNIKDDDVPQSFMDREGVLIFKALGTCKNIRDFENFLDTLSRPMGVEANFGVIDAEGGAAMYEVNNSSYVKYDVNDPSVAPDGYLVFTNFSFSGRKEDYKGYERYLTASAVFGEAVRNGTDFTPEFIFDSLSRSFRHEFLGVDYTRDLRMMMESGMCSGIVPDQDFIPRRSTSASVVVQGTVPGGDPLETVMWTLLGYPPCGVAVPVPVAERDIIPGFMKASGESGHSPMCDISLDIKYRHVFRFSLSNGSEYLDLRRLLFGDGDTPSIISCCRKVESGIIEDFFSLYSVYIAGEISRETFLDRYGMMSGDFFSAYSREMDRFVLKQLTVPRL